MKIAQKCFKLAKWVHNVAKNKMNPDMFTKDFSILPKLRILTKCGHIAIEANVSTESRQTSTLVLLYLFHHIGR